MKVTDSHSVKDLTELSIFRGETYVGILRRTTKGCEIKFDPTFINNDSYKTFTYRLQKREAISTYAGVNLPPFFAGLLPEGLRLKALIEELKTSTDDLFSLLTASGESTIGDIFVTTELLTRPKLTVSDVKRIDFYEIFQNTLKTGVMAKGEDGIAGIQEKVSASMISFPIHAAKRDKSYILKLNPRDKPNLVQNEFQCLKLAQKCGIEAANAKLVSDMNDNSAPTFLNEKREKYKAQGKKVLDGVKAIDDLRESLKKARKKKWIGFTWQVPALAAQTVGTIVGGSLLIEYYSGLRRLFSITTGTTLLTGFVAGKPFFKNIREVKALKSDLSRLEMEFERDLAQNAKNRAIVEQFSKAVNAPEDAMIPSSDWYKMPEAI